MPSDLIDTISAYAQVLIGVGTLTLSYVLWKSGEKRARVEYMKSLQDGWNNLNALVLSNPELAKILDSVLSGSELDEEDMESRLQRYMQYKVLNIIEAEFIGKRSGLVSDDYHDAVSDDILAIMLKNKRFREIVKKSGFHKEFVDHCDAITSEITEEVEQAHPADAKKRRG